MIHAPNELLFLTLSSHDFVLPNSSLFSEKAANLQQPILGQLLWPSSCKKKSQWMLISFNNRWRFNLSYISTCYFNMPVLPVYFIQGYTHCRWKSLLPFSRWFELNARSLDPLIKIRDKTRAFLPHEASQTNVGKTRWRHSEPSSLSLSFLLQLNTHAYSNES